MGHTHRYRLAFKKKKKSGKESQYVVSRPGNWFGSDRDSGCDNNGVTEKALKLCMFPLSLSDRANHWLTSQPLDSITSWNDLVQKFLTKIFPPTKIAQLVQEINTFT